jgi:DNA-binding NtrC family response regulator
MRTVLSISKDRELLFLRGKILEGAGYRVISVISPEEAEQQFLTEQIDAVLIGHTLTFDEALKVAKNAKQVSTGQIKVCQLRKHWSSSVPKEFVDSYIDAYARPEDLIGCINEVLGK